LHKQDNPQRTKEVSIDNLNLNEVIKYTTSTYKCASNRQNSIPTNIVLQVRDGRRRGIIRHPGGNIIIKFVWGLSVVTNNEVEAFALYESIRLTLLNGIQRINICGDSIILIRTIIKKNIAGSNIYISVSNTDPGPSPPI